MHNNGGPQTLIKVDGTIPTFYNQRKYNIPICIWLSVSRGGHDVLRLNHKTQIRADNVLTRNFCFFNPRLLDFCTKIFLDFVTKTCWSFLTQNFWTLLTQNFWIF